MKRYIITALCAFIVCRAWGQLNAPCFTIDIPENTPALYNNIPLTIDEDSTVIELDDTPIYALAVTGQVEMHTANNSMARIILVDNYGTEYLVYEVNSLLTDTNMVSFENVGRETLWQDMIFASHLVVRLTNATVTMNIPTLVTELLEQSSPAIKRARAMAQNDTIVNVLNRNLAARDIPWRAGATNLSEASYDVRRSVLGDDNPFHNIEYYIGGYYVDPSFDVEQSPAIDDGCVEEFDWRNRHGRNWITPAKRQWRKDCWAFAAIATAESYINLYYNKNINIDLSEQQLDSVVRRSTFAEGGYIDEAHKYMTQNELVTENCYPYKYMSTTGETDAVIYIEHERCKEPDTIFQFADYQTLGSSNKEIKAKQTILKAPFSMDIGGMQHVLSCIGYKVVEIGDTIYEDGLWYHYPADTITENSPYIGKTAWILKNSYLWYRDGDRIIRDTIGVRYMIVDDYHLLARSSLFKGNVFSNQFTDSDIICSDADNDGYYFWGIGDKPAHCPVWASNIPDGDDSNPMYGAMDEYGHLDSIGPAFKEPLIIDTNTTWSSPQVIPSDLIIPSGVTLTVTSYLTMHPDATITIEGGQLIVDGGTIRNGDINNKGSLVVKNNGIIEMCDDDRYRHNTKDIVHISNFKSPFNKFTQIKNGGFKRVNR